MQQSLFKVILLALIVAGISVSQPVAAQQTGLLVELFGNNSKKKSSSSTKTKSSKTSSTKKKTNSSTSKSGSTDLLTALTGKTAEQRAKEAAERQKKAAREKAIADAARKKAAEKRAKDAAAREKQKAIEKAAELAKKEKAASEKAKALAEKKKAEEARKLALAKQRAKEEKARELAAQARARETARRKAEEEKIRAQQRADAELVAQAQGRSRGGGIFGMRSRSSSALSGPRPLTSQPSRYLYINEREISRLNSSNSRVEIDLSDQRARIYNGGILVIETQISSGKPGHTTPTGNYSVQEKLVDKQSGRYGTWFNAGGAQLKGDDKLSPPSGAVKFVGADMPYWMRITGGIGMHVGYVPNGPASHGCVRVPPNVQPLIFSKVKVGTPVRIRS